MRSAFLVVFASVAIVLAGGCEAAVSSDLGTVTCKQANVIGPPACATGSICSGGVCVACASADLCGDNVDNDCDGLIDNGCPVAVGAGGHGTGGSGGAGVAGQSAGAGGVSPAGGNAGANAGNGGDGSIGGGRAGESGEGGSPPNGGNGGAPAGGEGGTGVAGSAGSGTAGTSAGGSPPVGLGYGDACSPTDSCPSDASCVDWGELGETMSGAICTKPCCSSTQCGDALTAVCAPSPNGASMCMPGALFNRGQVGIAGLGAPCGTSDPPTFCRSGFCVDGACNDVCCKDANCAGTAKPACVKNYLSDESPIRYGYQCGVAKGTKPYASPSDSCTQDSQCQSYACDLDTDVGTFCAKDCCVSSECGSVNLFGIDTYQIACVYSTSAHGLVRSCAAASDAWGTGVLGDACTLDTDCSTDKCIADEQGAQYCTDTCCKNDDCGGGVFHCGPYLAPGDTVAVFRCIR